MMRKNPDRRARAGFTMLELMIAIMVMGVGLAMTASLFPAAIKETEQSVHSTIGTQIAQNGAAVVQTRLTYDDMAGVGTMFTDGPTDGPLETLNASADARFPIPVDSGDKTPYGFLALARRPVSGTNDFEILVVPYLAFADDSTIRWQPATVDVDNGDAKKVTLSLASDPDYGRIPVKSPVIRASNGSWATILSKDGTTVELDREIDDLVDGDGVWLVVETGGSEVQKHVSPAIGVFLTRTALSR